MARLRKGKVMETLDSSFSSPAAEPETKRDIWDIHPVKEQKKYTHTMCDNIQVPKYLDALKKTFVNSRPGTFGYCAMVFLVYTSYTLRHQAVYLNYLVHPFLNSSDPESCGISNARNLYIQGEDGRLGVWHVLPKSSSKIDDGKPIILYMHGNAYSRNSKHRIGVYKVLTLLGCHVIAFDYRGFGDSDGYPTEDGVINDSLTMFHWIKANANRSPIYLWGHSLGSAIAIGVAKILTEADIPIMGLVLEAPFSNMKDAAIGHPLSLPFRILPNFPDILQEINDLFKSDESITSVTCSILILHDHEDKIVGIELGKKLYAAALKGRKDHQSIEFKEFRGYGHKYIFKSEELPVVLRTFMNLETDD